MLEITATLIYFLVWGKQQKENLVLITMLKKIPRTATLIYLLVGGKHQKKNLVLIKMLNLKFLSLGGSKNSAKLNLLSSSKK
jgi:hypothetical protein